MELLKETAAIISAYVANNPVPQADVPALIKSVHATLAGLSTPADTPAAGHSPAVPVKKSVTPDSIICLECGKPLKMIKRHLRSDHSLTVEEYRARWNLPFDYPTTAENYAAQRSEFAKKIGLGRNATGRKAAA